MSWLLELLVDAIREMCSQFIVDMMELITNMFTELLSCNLSLFEELFSVVGSLYKNVIVPTGIAILLMILVWQLFKSMFGGKAGVNAEEPIELICRSAISLFLLAGSKPLIDYILRIAGTPYQWVVGTKVKVASFSGYVSTLEGVTDTLGISSLSISVLMLIMQFVVAWNYFKMLIKVKNELVEAVQTEKKQNKTDQQNNIQNPEKSDSGIKNTEVVTTVKKTGQKTGIIIGGLSFLGAAMWLSYRKFHRKK